MEYVVHIKEDLNCMSNQDDRSLLAHYGARLHGLYKEVRSLPVSCQFYPLTSWAASSNHGILAIWSLGAWCCGPYHSKIFTWPLVHLTTFTNGQKQSRQEKWKKKMSLILFEPIFYRYSVPRHIITGNGKPFINKLVTALCEKFKFT